MIYQTNGTIHIKELNEKLCISQSPFEKRFRKVVGNYYGANNHVAKVPAKYEILVIAENANIEVFKAELLAHQQGKTDFMCADTGIEKWEIDMDKMTCTYFDKAGNKILVEQIPA